MGNRGEPTIFVIDASLSAVESLENVFSSIGLHAEYFTTVGACLRQLAPDSRGCLVGDTATPGCLDLTLSRRLDRLGIDLPVIYLSDDDRVATAVAVLKAGAAEFLRKPVHDQDLVDAVQQAVLANQRAAEYRHQQALVWRRFSALTPREWEVLPQVVRGQSNRQIGTSLGVSGKTIEVHRRHILRKTGAGNLAELIRIALAVELLDRVESEHPPDLRCYRYRPSAGPRRAS